MAEQQTTEEVKNCPQCKKPMKRSKRYYRNGQYFCNINCYKASKPGKAEAVAEAPAGG